MVAPPCEDVALMVAPPCEEVTLSDDETTVSGEESAEAMLGNLVAPPGSGTAANAVAEGSEGAADDSMEVDEEVPLPKLVELIDIDADSPMEVDEAELEQVAPPGEQTVGHEVAGSAEGAGEVGESQQRGGDSESAAGGQQTGSADNAAGRSNDGAGSRGSGAPSEGTQDGLQSHGSELGMEIPTEITPTSKVDAVADQVITRVKSEPIDEEYKDEPEVLILFEKLVNVKTEPVSDQVVGVLSDSEPKSSQDSASKLGISRHICIVCKQMRKCKYNIVRNGDVRHLCTDECFKKFRSNAQVYLSSPTTPPGQVNCTVCDKSVTVTSSTLQLPGDPPKYACSQPCLLTASRVQVPEKSCSQCQKLIKEESGRKQLLSWESMDFCSENCLGRFQSNLTASCAACAAEIVPRNQAKIVFKVEGEMKQFCSPACLKTYRNRLKMCSFCDKNITSCAETFSLPVAEEKGGGVKDFCSRKCTTHYETKLRIQRGDSSVVGAHCSVCSAGGRAKHEVLYEGGRHRLCSDACFAAFRYANKLAVNTCDNCGVFCFNEDSTPHYIQFEGATKRFCSFMCMSAFKVLKQKVAACTWCQSKKLNFDMIERTDSQSKYQLFCSLNCLSLYRVNLSATSSKQVKCDQCCALQPAQYHLTMSDASVRNFCSYGCVMTFQNQFTKSGKVPPATPARQQTTTTTTTTTAQETAQEARRQSQVHADRALQDKRKQNQQQRQQQQRQRGVAGLPQTPTPLLPQTQTRVYITTSASLASMTPVISQVMSLAPAQKSTQVSTMPVRSATLGAGIRQPPPLSLPQTMVADHADVDNGFKRQQLPAVIGFVVEDESIKPVLVPIPVPVFVPVPVCMYTQPAPIPFAFPVPVPIPCFIPTTKNSAAAIFEHIKEIQEKIPSDPFEADLIMMAAMIAEENTEEQKPPTPTCISPAAEDEDEDVASPLCDPPSEAQSNEDTAPVEAEPAPPVREPSPVTTPLGEISQDNDVENHIPTMTMSLRRPEPVTASPSRGTKRSRRGGNTRSRKKKQEPAAQPPPLQSLSASTAEPGPDASCSLKYTYGVTHEELGADERMLRWRLRRRTAAASSFKTELLQMTAEELSYSLCLFVKEVRKPNGECYASDSVYYLCLGIQSFLYENGRVDNIFTDLYYMKFADCLHELISSYEPIISGEGYVLGRIEEEILWESRQLGAHSPNVLLNTLMYFNSKYFHLKDVAEHMQLSFSQILKHWRRKPDPDSGKKPPRTIFLRYFPLTLEKQRGPKRKSQDDSMWLEQAEKLDNPLRCPVKLYEFYLSKCPESMKNKSDVYYLIPERSCVPDSPVWYSTLPLTSDQVGKMLTRIKMTREINEALYNSAMLPT
ncbi:PREDICTED: LOW QUALITY PROTEIN: zinc finger MYM-type protein 3-like [Priapulus caudatus]|uniref:LOW QUALITY PROTEIN: zinc finger MYM-type protein 3-like n=1 Tax=Priapulus caudatus TaxID=37621 RepID=A0ABM1E5H9_PRICU|nr:PREDICTED: LOW QUALITY PROTEIN: zinc finger MYM-type protein 3-like [Priapulus caudatus]